MITVYFILLNSEIHKILHTRFSAGFQTILKCNIFTSSEHLSTQNTYQIDNRSQLNKYSLVMALDGTQIILCNRIIVFKLCNTCFYCFEQAEVRPEEIIRLRTLRLRKYGLQSYSSGDQQLLIFFS